MIDQLVYFTLITKISNPLILSSYAFVRTQKQLQIQPPQELNLQLKLKLQLQQQLQLRQESGS